MACAWLQHTHGYNIQTYIAWINQRQQGIRTKEKRKEIMLLLCKDI